MSYDGSAAHGAIGVGSKPSIDTGEMKSVATFWQES